MVYSNTLDQISTLQHLLLGGPGGTRLPIPTVAALLVKLEQLVTLGTYPHTGQAVSRALELVGVRQGAPRHTRQPAEDDFQGFRLGHLHDQDTRLEDLNQVRVPYQHLSGLSPMIPVS